MASIMAIQSRELAKTYNSLKELRDDQWRMGEADLKIPFTLIDKVLKILRHINENGTGAKRHR